MINLSHFRYATTKVGFGAAGASAATTASNNTDKIKSMLATSVSGASSSSPFESASQDNISGNATLATKAAIARIKADGAAKNAALLKQLDGAQTTLDAARKATASTPSTVLSQAVNVTA